MTTEWTPIRSWPVVLLERLGDTGVARIVLNRPEKRNALSHELIGSYLEALEEVRSDDSIVVLVTKGNGPTFSAGLDLYDLKSTHEGRLPDWDKSTPSTNLYETVRKFPRVTIAQVHGHCLGGAVALLNSHDLAVASRSVKIGMPEIFRGSYGQNVTATLFHAAIPFKKAALMQLSGRNLSGDEADRLGVVSFAVDDADLEDETVKLACEIAQFHPAALQHAKIAVQLGRDLPLPHAIEVDRLVTARMFSASNPFSKLDDYLSSRKTTAG